MLHALLGIGETKREGSEKEDDGGNSGSQLLGAWHWTKSSAQIVFISFSNKTYEKRMDNCIHLTDKIYIYIYK